MALLGKHRSRIVTLMENRRVDYYHTATDTTLENVPAYFKSKLRQGDRMGDRDQYAFAQVFRIDGLPWDDIEMAGDIITERGSGESWVVDQADKLPIGIATLYCTPRPQAQ